MSLSDNYTLPSEEILESRRRITVPTIAMPWNEAEKAARDYNDKINTAFNKCEPSAKIIKNAVSQIKQNLDSITTEIKKALPFSWKLNATELISKYVSENPQSLIVGLDDMTGSIESLEFGRRALEPVLQILKTGKAPEVPIERSHYFPLLMNLDEYQVIAIDNEYRVVILLAGAGSGKTRVLTSWVSMQILSGTKPCDILCISFSDDSMKVMRERIHKSYPDVNIYTFHGFTLKMLCENANLVKGGFDSSKVLDDVGQKRILHNIVNEINAEVNVDDILRVMKFYVLNGIQPDSATDLGEIQKYIFGKYQEEKRRETLIDFDDMILTFHNTLTESTAFRLNVELSCKVIAFDEVQDAFSIFIDCLKLICSTKRMLIVGDPSQRIYAFAGSTSNAFNEIQTKIGGELMVLPYNHRSTPDLVKAMDLFIRTNPREIVRPVIPAREVSHVKTC